MNPLTLPSPLRGEGWGEGLIDPSHKFFQILSEGFEAVDGAFPIGVTQGDPYHDILILRDIEGIFYLVFISAD